MDSSGKTVDKDGFTYVHYKKKKHDRKTNGKQPSEGVKRSAVGGPSNSPTHSYGSWSLSSASSCTDDDLLEVEQIYRQLEGAVAKVKGSAFFESFLKVLAVAVDELQCDMVKSEIRHIVCFALGTLTRRASRYQFGLLRCIQEHLGPIKVCLYDPVFTKVEKAVFTSKYGYKVLEYNSVGKYGVDSNPDVSSSLTFFYLPHAEHELMNNLLYSNWSPAQLNKCIILGNSYAFWGYMNGHAIEVSREFKCTDDDPRHPFYYLHLAGALCNERDVVNNFEYDEIFMQSALHTFPQDKLKKWNDDNIKWLRVTPPPKPPVPAEEEDSMCEDSD